MEIPRDFVVLDTETTGSPPGARLVEIGAVAVRGGTVIDRFESLVYPEGPIPPETTAVHGITDEDVAEAPDASVVLPAFLKWLRGRPLMAHNAPFDAAVLASECARFGIEPGENEVLCTLTASRKLLGHRSHSLENLVRDLGLPPAPHHRAAADAEHALQLYWRLLDIAAHRFNRRTLGSRRALSTFLPVPPRLPASRAVLAEAAAQGEAVELHYSVRGQHLMQLRVSPRFFYSRRRAVLMEALCHRELHYKSYRLDRIVAAHPCLDAPPAEVRRPAPPAKKRA